MLDCANFDKFAKNILKNMFENAFEKPRKTGEKPEKKSEKTSSDGLLRIQIGNILLSAGGPLTVANIRVQLQQMCQSATPSTVRRALKEIACDQHRILTVTPLRCGAKKVPTAGYTLTPKTAA